MFKRKVDREAAQLFKEQRGLEIREIKRREFCVTQATFLDDATPSNLIELAEKIYVYCYGDRK